MRDDDNFKVFLEFDKDVCVPDTCISRNHAGQQIGCRARSKKDIAVGFFKSVGKSMDSSFTTHKDSDEFYEEQKFFVVHYNAA